MDSLEDNEEPTAKEKAYIYNPESIDEDVDAFAPWDRPIAEPLEVLPTDENDEDECDPDGGIIMPSIRFFGAEYVAKHMGQMI